jgi:hypothetical protein
VDGAVLLFRCASRKTVEQFVQKDPYVSNGLVASWRIREYNSVVGALAATPLRPDAL